MSDELRPDRVTYSESRTINIGQYENVHVYFSYTGDVKRFNRQDNTVKISHSESAIADQLKDFNDTAKILMKRTKRVLNTRERELRLASLDYVTDPLLQSKMADSLPSKEDCL